MTDQPPDFSSDNIAPIAPEIMDAMLAANQGTVHSYGADPWTEKLTEVAQSIFECDLEIFPVATGTAANSLALAAISPPHGGIFCHESSHIENDECGAPEFFTAGAKLLGLPGANGILSVAPVAQAFAKAADRGIHNVRPAAISISQATESGTVYTPAAIAELAAFGREKNLPLHMDGARLANAIAHLGCTPAQATWQAGVDVLSLGATKNGAMAAEAVIFFKPALAVEFGYRRKRAGQLFSKMRFVSAQLAAYLQDGLWLRYAANANAMATRLADGLAALPAAELLFPVQANELFVALPEKIILALQAEGFGFYRWPARENTSENAIRLVTSWNTTTAEVDALLTAIRSRG
jgi:threonine aldolase